MINYGIFCTCRIYEEYRRTCEWLNWCFCCVLCCVAMFWCLCGFWAYGYPKSNVLTDILIYVIVIVDPISPEPGM